MKKAYNTFNFIVVLLILALPVTLPAQPGKLGGWHIANVNYHATKHVYLYADAQTHSEQLTGDFYYYELKAGITYKFPKNNSISFGAGDYRTYSSTGNFKSPLAVNEFRMWEQFALNHNISRIKIEHRFGIEQRWINGIYRGRFRYRVNPVLPLNHAAITPHTLYATAYDEIFFISNPPYFDRNRIFGGLGYRFTKLYTLQLGFIRQYSYKTGEHGTGKNFIQTSFLFNIDHTAVHRENHPASID